MAKVYCKLCGQSFSSVNHLTMGFCVRHPDGAFKGRHILYEGTEKSQYTCKYCGQKFSSLNALTFGQCVRHPNGTFKGKHSPAL